MILPDLRRFDFRRPIHVWAFPPLPDTTPQGLVIRNPQT